MSCNFGWLKERGVLTATGLEEKWAEEADCMQAPYSGGSWEDTKMNCSACLEGGKGKGN